MCIFCKCQKQPARSRHGNLSDSDTELVEVSRPHWAAVFSVKYRPRPPPHKETPSCARVVAAGSPRAVPPSSWVRWKDNGIVLHNEFQAFENKRIEREGADVISVMNVQIRAPNARPERHPQLHARRDVAPGVFALGAVSLHECPYFL